MHLVLSLATLSVVFASVTTRPVDPCFAACLATPECVNDPRAHFSYCKRWQSPPTCFGLYIRPDTGALRYCFQPNDPRCLDRVYRPLTCEAFATLVPTTTTRTPTTTTRPPTTTR